MTNHHPILGLFMCTLNHSPEHRLYYQLGDKAVGSLEIIERPLILSSARICILQSCLLYYVLHESNFHSRNLL